MHFPIFLYYIILYVKVDEQKINADTILGLLNSKVLQYKKVSFDHVLFWVFKCFFAHPNPYCLLHGDITALGERNWSPLSYFFVMVTLQPWVTWGFHLSNPMNVHGCRSPLNQLPNSAHTGDQRVGMFSLSFLCWQFKK